MPTLRVQWLHPDGSGGGRAAEGVVHVPGALPGDEIRYRETGRGRGELEEVVVASPDRMAPPCPWDARCGGCDLSALAPKARHHHLARVVQRAFDLEAAPEVVPSPRAEGHRARIDLEIRQGRVGYHGARSAERVEVDTCRIARPEVQEGLGALRAWLAASPSEGLSRVQLRSDGARVVFAFSSAGSVPRAVRDALADLGHVALDGRALHGDPTLWLEVGGVRLRASPRSFFQVNHEIDALLVEHVRALVRDLAPERVLDVYAGIGNLTLPLAADGWPAAAVEREGAALADLRASADLAGLSVHTVGRPAEKVDFRRLPADVVVLDPPRAGAAKIMARLLENRPRALVYVTCFPVSAARDLRRAGAAGYRLASARCFDMFPETRHMETVVVATRE